MLQSSVSTSFIYSQKGRGRAGHSSACLPVVLSYSLSIFTDPINLCSSYTNLCSSLQLTFQCPDPINQAGCEGPTAPKSNYATYDGQCACGGVNATRLEQNIVYHEIFRAHAMQSLLVAAANNAEASDYCASYTNTCSAFLNGIACPASEQTNIGCEILGNVSSFVNQCNCAGAVDGSLEARNSIIEFLTKPKVS